jgi:hypothetical protein
MASGSPPTPITLAVYRDLRLSMVVVLVLLAGAIFIEWSSAKGRWQSELSAYFYTSAHSIFIAALLALGTLLMVFKGRTYTEDKLLTLAGICALIIAVVPMGRTKPLGPFGLPDDYKVEAVIPLNVLALVIALGVGLALALLRNRLTGTPWPRSRKGKVSQRYIFWLTRCIFWLIMAVGLIAFKFFPDTVKQNLVHGAAGVLMLLAFIATTFCTACGWDDVSKPPRKRGYKRSYWWIACLMLVTLITVVPVHLVHPKWLGVPWGLVAEVALILEFAAYWVVQTIEQW